MKCLYAVLVLLVLLISSCTYYNEEELYPSSTCDTINVTYATHVKPILDVNCISCHNTTTNYNNVILIDSAHASVVAANGELKAVINHEGSIKMPKGKPKLSDCKIRTLELWIEKFK